MSAPWEVLAGLGVALWVIGMMLMVVGDIVRALTQ